MGVSQYPKTKSGKQFQVEDSHIIHYYYFKVIVGLF